MAAAIGSTSTITYAQRTNTVITAPSGIANNDVLVAILLVGGVSVPTVAPPSGFSEVTTTGWPISVDEADPTWQLRLKLYWKVASSESGDYTFSHSSARSEAIMYRITGADTTTPISPNPTSATGTGQTATATGLTTPRAGSVVIYATGAWDAAGPTTPPTGTTPTFTEYFDAGSTGILYSAAGVMATAGATGNKSNTNSNNSSIWPWLAGLICVQSAASGGATYNYSATGGIATGGTATLKRTRASTASGGVSTGGASSLKLVKTESGAGGVATGGVAALKRSFARSASGGLATGGTAPIRLVKTTTASGGITTGGTATLKRTQAIAATGGITTGGAAGLKRTQATTATGGIVTGGAATASKSSPGQNSHTASGGVATGGAATLKRSFARLATGGLSTGGAAVLKRIRAYLASGGLTTGGAASVTLTAGAFSYVASGGIAAGGSASLRILLHYLASGGVTIGGAASAYAWSSVMVLPHGYPAFARLSSVAAMERIPPLARVA